MLNPRNFLADCIRYGKLAFWATGMPWHAINAAIDNSTFEYDPGEAARQRFVSKTGRSWNNLDEPPAPKTPCPRCRREVTVPWTSCDSEQSWNTSCPGESGYGFTDSEFSVRCLHCAFLISHDVLRTQMFRRDVGNLLLHDRPMPGTILALDGTIIVFL